MSAEDGAREVEAHDGAASAADSVSMEGFSPVDRETEVAVVASVLQDASLFDVVAEVLSPDDFGTPACAAVFSGMVACDRAGLPLDHLTVASKLEELGLISLAGGPEALVRLSTRPVFLEHVEAYCSIVASKALLRRLISAGRRISLDARAPDADADLTLEAAEKMIFDISRSQDPSSLIDMPEAVRRLSDALSRGRDRELLGCSTGFGRLDSLTGGFQAGQLILVAARPGMGKSSFALQLAAEIASSTGLVVPFYSFEMGVDELMLRLLAQTVRYDASRLRQGNVPRELEDEVAAALDKLERIPLMVDDNPPDTVTSLRSSLRRLARRAPLGAVFVDYLQLMQGERRSDSRANEVGEISRGLKRLAAELQVPVVALSQLNRSLELRPNKRPQLSDLRDSGTLEQDSNLVLFLHRESLFNPSAPEKAAECIIGKQRSGPLGTVMMEFDGPSTSFTQAAAAAGPSGSFSGSPF